MSTSIVAVMTNVIRDGATVTGYAFNSTGHYACGAQMRERLIPRILRQDPDSVLDPEHGGFDPDAIFRAMMFGEKPGRHGTYGRHRHHRSGALGRHGQDRG